MAAPIALARRTTDRLVLGIAVAGCVASIVVLVWWYKRAETAMLPSSDDSYLIASNQYDSAAAVDAATKGTRVSIPTIQLMNVPVLLQISGTDKRQYLGALRHGVAHYAATALPGEAGNVVLFGHSSYYASDSGEYKTVFAHLDKLNEGDEISIEYQGKSVKYKVTSRTVVEPTDLSVLQQDTSKHQLTLITCWPPGTIDKRLVVAARRQSAD